MMRRFGLHSNSRGTDEVKGLLISIDFCNRITELLFLFSIISPWHYNVFPVDKGRKLNVHKRFRRRPGRLLNVLCTFNLRPVCTGLFEFRANLSNDYFTNRQDRYIVFEDCPELSNYYDELVKTVSSFSFQLNEDNNVTLSPAFNIHPYKNSKKDFNQAAGNLIEKFTKQYANISFQKQTISITDSEDTLVFPLLQMKTFGIDQDEHVTSNILRSNQSNCCICLATAYFNCTDDYWKALLQGRGQVSVVMAHPKAMGFYKAPGLAGM